MTRRRRLLVPWAALVAGLFAAGVSAAPPAASPPADLPARYATWLEDVAPLLSVKEKAVFVALNRDYQRDEFIQRFWKVRDPFPQTPRNEFEEQWVERVKKARERFGGVGDDRARMLLYNGEPVHILRAHCSDVLLPLEIWSYDGTDRIRNGFSLVFLSALGSQKGPFRLWHPSEGLIPLYNISGQARSVTQRADLNTILQDCPEGQEIAGLLASALDWAKIEGKVPLVPQVSDEWLSGFLSLSTDVPTGAVALPADLRISYPGTSGSRTVVQGVVSVPKEGTTAETLQERAFYDFVIDGEVLRGDELFEHFRYRFTLPQAQVLGSPQAGIPLVFQRYLRPGGYTLVLKVEDSVGKRYFRDQRELDIPAVPAPPPGSEAVADATATHPAPAQEGVVPQGRSSLDALAEANAPVRSGRPEESSIHILAPPPGLIVGRTRVEALITGGNVARVRFELDGRPALTKSHPPYSVELSLGEQPRTHLVRALALGVKGEELAEDRILLNAGAHRFSVRLLEPQAGKWYKSSLRAEVQVEVPEGETLDRVELYLNDNRLATLYQPPFVQPVLLPENGTFTYVRAVAYLADGNSTEDLVLINSPNAGERMNVQLVELYTTVVDRKGRPVDGLRREEFSVSEDGVPQTVSRFELVRDLPIYAGVLIDTSGSMEEKLDDAVRGALRFFQTVIQPKDRAAVFTFSDQAHLAVRFTNDRGVLAGGLAGLQAQGNTVLYDCLIQALYYFGGIKGKRAIIILTDGRDEGSKYPYSQALEYARRSGVTIYTVGIGLTSKDIDARAKLDQLANETGGHSFFIERALELATVYSTIEKEMRSQYLVAYQSTKQGTDDKFRTVEVKVARPGVEAKTQKGYFP